MKSRFRKTQVGKILAVAIVVAFGLGPEATNAAQEGEGWNTVPLATVVGAVAKRSGKKFIVDPRVQGDAILFNANPGSLSYDDLLVLLNVHGFTAITTGDYVRVIPEASVRQVALPIADGDKHPLAEYVTRVIPVKSIPAPMLVPLLRPLIPQQGHLVALPCSNDLILVDTFGNTQRLEQVIKSLDHGQPYVPEKCKLSDIVRPSEKPAEKKD